MFFVDEGKNAAGKVEQLQRYMVDHGIYVKSDNYGDSSPHFILGGGTGVGYRFKSRWNQNGIVLFCSDDGTDKDNLTSSLGLIAYENSDKHRPYAVFIPSDQFEEAVEILKKNAKNLK